MMLPLDMSLRSVKYVVTLAKGDGRAGGRGSRTPPVPLLTQIRLFYPRIRRQRFRTAFHHDTPRLQNIRAM